MKLRTSLCVPAFVLVLVAPGQAAAPGDSQVAADGKAYVCERCSAEENPEKTLPPPAGTEVPFHRLEGYLIQVEGQIGSQDRLKFILDTGASMSMVDTKIADALGLKRQPAEAFNFDRILNWEQATIPDVRFGPIEAKNIIMLVGDMAKHSEFARSVDAVIGLDLLSSSNFTVDYAHRKIVFDAPIQRPNSTPDELSNCLILKIQVQGRPVRLIVDTGFPGILLFEERLLTSVPGIRLTRDVFNVTLGTRLRAKQTILENVAIGPTTKDVPVLLTKAPVPDMLPGIDGVVGVAALNARRVHFDFVKRTLNWD